MYLLDTNVVAELRRPEPHRSVLRWIADVPSDQLFLSAVTVGEIQGGIADLIKAVPAVRVVSRDEDFALWLESVRAATQYFAAVKKTRELEAWLEQVIDSHSVLPMDAATFRECARLKRHESRALLEDAMIAATASVHGLTVATRNVRDFELLGVAHVNPFGSSETLFGRVTEARPTVLDWELGR